MATFSQISANRKNAQNSCGPSSTEGKAASSRNNFQHGLTGVFILLPEDNRDEFNALIDALRQDHQPETATETLLVEKMAQHQWLSQRAVNFQTAVMLTKAPVDDQQRSLALYIRYQTSNDRAFHKCLDQLLKIRAERRKEAIGFESQRLREADQTRKENAEKRKNELHQVAISLAEARLARELNKQSAVKAVCAPTSVIEEDKIEKKIAA